MRDQIQGQRDATWASARAVLDVAAREKRELTAAEDQRYTQYMSDLDASATRLRMLDEDVASEARDAAWLDTIKGGRNDRGSISDNDSTVAEAFRTAVRTRSIAPFDLSLRPRELRSGFQPGIEQRVLATTSGSGMVGTTFYSQLQRHMVETAAILAAGATVIQTESGEALKVPKSTAFSTAAIVAEGTTIGASDPALGSITLGAWKYGFLVQSSYELIEDAKFDILAFLAEQAGIALGNAFGAHAITGTGTGQPRGVLIDATLGITGPTGVGGGLGAQATVGQGGDLLLDLSSSLAEPYARSKSAAWMMRGTTLNVIRKLRDSTGKYIFSTDIVPGSGSSGTILGRPVFVDPSMPAIGVSAKSIAFGDWSKVWARQVNGIRFERSDDYAFANDLATFRCLARLDSALVDTTGAIKYFAGAAT